jgi:hypothetical protein
MKEAIFRLIVDYPRAMDAFLDESILRNRCEGTFDFHLLRRPREEARLRLAADESIAGLGPLKMLNLFWDSVNQHPADSQALRELAAVIIETADSGILPEEKQ